MQKVTCVAKCKVISKLKFHITIVNSGFHFIASKAQNPKLGEIENLYRTTSQLHPYFPKQFYATSTESHNFNFYNFLSKKGWPVIQAFHDWSQIYVTIENIFRRHGEVSKIVCVLCYVTGGCNIFNSVQYQIYHFSSDLFQLIYFSFSFVLKNNRSWKKSRNKKINQVKIWSWSFLLHLHLWQATKKRIGWVGFDMLANFSLCIKKEKSRSRVKNISTFSWIVLKQHLK